MLRQCSIPTAPRHALLLECEGEYPTAVDRPDIKYPIDDHRGVRTVANSLAPQWGARAGIQCVQGEGVRADIHRHRDQAQHGKPPAVSLKRLSSEF